MTEADLPLGMRLKTEAGWNQTLEDWQRFFRLSNAGSFVASIDGVDLGTVCTFRFGDVAWIAMVLVDARSRGQGVGTALMNHALAHLDEQGVKSIRLDATPLGRPVYLKLGFVDQFELNRYVGTLPGMDMMKPAQVEGITQADWDEVISLDALLMGTDRASLLRALLAEQSEVNIGCPGDDASGRPFAFLHRQQGNVTGYILGRPGANATFIGPCVADTPAAGESLLAMAARACSGRDVIIDIPTEHHHANVWARAMKLEVQRPLMRMARGLQVLENVSALWASSGPEKG